jgi:hypothetical protein
VAHADSKGFRLVGYSVCIDNSPYSKIWEPFRRSRVLSIPETPNMSTPEALANLVSRPGESTGPLMSITCWCLVGVSAVFLVVRLAIRHSQKKLWFDDLLLTLSWVKWENPQAKHGELIVVRCCLPLKSSSTNSL